MATYADTQIEKQEQALRPSHQYHAEAHVLSGELKRPIEQKIEQHAPVSLKSLRGGHLTRFAEEVSIESLISFQTGHTRVSGSRSLKHNGWVTLSTSVMEDMNVFEVITADRVVAQVSTEHLNEPGRKPDHVPRVTFLGTQFKNLRVSGIPLKLTLDLGICGEKPEGDKPYVTDHKFLSAVQEQVKNIARSPDLPKAFKDKYDGRLAEIETLRNGNGAGKGTKEPNKVKCSLVKSIHIDNIEQIPGLKTGRKCSDYSGVRHSGVGGSRSGHRAARSEGPRSRDGQVSVRWIPRDEQLLQVDDARDGIGLYRPWDRQRGERGRQWAHKAVILFVLLFLICVLSCARRERADCI